MHATAQILPDATITETHVFDVLRTSVGAWYEAAYGARAPYETMIEFYASGTKKRAATLLGPLYEKLMQTPPARVLDVGAGFASIPVYLASHWPDAQFLITDIRDDYYACGKRAVEQLGLRGFQFAVSDVAAVDTHQRYDLVMSCNMLNFMHSKDKLEVALKTLATVTAPGGHLVIYTPHFWSVFEPFTRIPMLHWLPMGLQNFIVRTTKKRDTLSDTRNPSLREITHALEAHGMRCVGVTPTGFLARLRTTHITAWFEKHA